MAHPLDCFVPRNDANRHIIIARQDSAYSASSACKKTSVINSQSLNHRAEVLEDFRDFAHAVHRVQVVLAFVEVEYGARLGLIFHKAVLDGLEVVIGATAGLAAFQHALDEHFLGHFEAQHACQRHVEFLHHFFEDFRLFHRARIAVEEETGRVHVLGEFLFDDFRHDLVGDEVALADDFLHLQTQFAFGGDFLAQDFARGDIGQVVFLAQELRLRSLACPGRAKEDDV